MLLFFSSRRRHTSSLCDWSSDVCSSDLRPITGLAELPGVHDLLVDGAHARFDVDTAEIGRTLRHLTQFDVSSLTSTPPTLEELFLRHYGDELAREPEAMETTA